MSVERLHVELDPVVKPLPGFSGAATIDDRIAGRNLPAEFLRAESPAKAPGVFLAKVTNSQAGNVDPHRFVVVGIVVFRHKGGNAVGGCAVLVVFSSQALNRLLVVGLSDDLEIEIAGWRPMVSVLRQWVLLPGQLWRPMACFERRPLFVPVPDSPESKEDQGDDEPIHAHSFQGR